MKSKLARPAVFGGFDGTASLLGVIVYLLVRHPAFIFPAALSGAISSALSMGAGEWLSGDSGTGGGAAVVMATATFTGALLPAVPFAFTTGTPAIAASAVIAVGIGVTVAVLRPDRGLDLALAETFGLLITIVGVCSLLSLTLPGGGV